MIYNLHFSDFQPVEGATSSVFTLLSFPPTRWCPTTSVEHRWTGPGFDSSHVDRHGPTWTDMGIAQFQMSIQRTWFSNLLQNAASRFSGPTSNFSELAVRITSFHPGLWQAKALSISTRNPQHYWPIWCKEVTAVCFEPRTSQKASWIELQQQSIFLLENVLISTLKSAMSL